MSDNDYIRLFTRHFDIGDSVTDVNRNIGIVHELHTTSDGRIYYRIAYIENGINKISSPMPYYLLSKIQLQLF